MKGHTGHKEHHHRKHRATGGENQAAEDLKRKNERYTYESKVNDEAEERKHGGRTKRKHGGHVKHHAGEHHEVHGEHAKHHAGRKPRKSGGRTGSDKSPFSSARHGKEPMGHKVDLDME